MKIQNPWFNNEAAVIFSNKLKITQNKRDENLIERQQKYPSLKIDRPRSDRKE